jgi:hypothetical protein
MQQGPYQSYFDPRVITKSVSPGLPGEIIFDEGDASYDVFQVGAGAVPSSPSPTTPGGGSSTQASTAYDPAKNFWFPVAQEGYMAAQVDPTYDASNLPKRAKQALPGDAQTIVVGRGSVVKRWFIVVNGTDFYIWAAEEDLQKIADKLATAMAVPPGYMDPGEIKTFSGPNWLLVGGVALGAAAIIGTVIFLRGK